MTSFFNNSELSSLQFKSIGNKVNISRLASFYDIRNISIGNNVRIDDFCILSGNITLGNNIHIAAGTYLFGGNAGIILKDFSNLSSRIAIYAESDDYSGITLTNPTIPNIYKNLTKKLVVINKHVIIGTGSVILPGVDIGEGVAIGALSLVNKSLPPWKICVGIPAVPVKERKKDLLKLEEQYNKYSAP